MPVEVEIAGYVISETIRLLGTIDSTIITQRGGTEKLFKYELKSAWYLCLNRGMYIQS